MQMECELHQVNVVVHYRPGDTGSIVLIERNRADSTIIYEKVTGN